MVSYNGICVSRNLFCSFHVQFFGPCVSVSQDYVFEIACRCENLLALIAQHFEPEVSGSEDVVRIMDGSLDPHVVLLDFGSICLLSFCWERYSPQD